MQRQSLGSPSPRHHPISGDAVSAFLESTEELKATKPTRGIVKSVHFIPVLTLLCFLVLYLSSHDPSPSDMVTFSGSSSSLLIHSKATNEMAATMSQRGLKADPDLLHIRKMGIH